MDHAARRFKLPDTSHINTYNKHVPPLLIIQIQIPSEAPQSFFTSPDDGPGWAIMMYFKITEVRTITITLYSFVVTNSSL